MQLAVDEFLKPKLVGVEELGANKVKVILEPLERGFGHTLFFAWICKQYKWREIANANRTMSTLKNKQDSSFYRGFEIEEKGCKTPKSVILTSEVQQNEEFPYSRT